MKKVLDYILHMMEGNDNGLSIRRVIAMILLGFIGYLILGDRITTQLVLNAFYALLTAILLLISVITIQNILEFFNKPKDPQ